MNINLAYNTLRAFDECIRRDQGAAFRQFEGQVFPHIDDAYRGEDEGFRSHLGASVIGRDCGREVWYGFRWASKPTHSGQMLRLFNRGHLEEARFIALMLTIGVQVYQQDANGKQFRISEYGGHFGGSGDGVVIGLPDVAAGVPALSEFKTHNDKSFIKLAGSNWKKFYEALIDPKLPQVPFEGEGVRSAKFEHWIQMQIYMRKMGLAVALYCAVNKNDDHIYAELVPLDTASADNFIERARTIINSHAAPMMINKSPGAYACKYCDHKPVCKLGKNPERNCRTCQYAEPNLETGAWTCENKSRQMDMVFGPKPGVSEPGETFTLTKERQLMGCEHYVKNPSM